MHARFDAEGFEGIFEGKGVHDGRHHAHVVGCGAVHTACLGGYAAEDVAAADNDADLYAHFDDFGDFTDGLDDGVVVDAERVGTHQGFAGEFQ